MDTGSAKPAGRPKWAWAIQAVVFLALWVAAIFASAGTLHWLRGWIYLGEQLAGIFAVGVISHRYNPGLIQARSRWRRADTKRFDKFLVAVYIPLTYVQPAVAGLDAVRFGWSSMPFAFLYVGVVLFAAATAIVAWVLAVNRFAETTVRIQSERGHTVVTSGPYRIVRHPMYVGGILTHLSLPLILGSVWALALTGALTVLLIVRTRLEDQTLQRELPGYAEYAEHTRYRLIPGLW